MPDNREFRKGIYDCPVQNVRNLVGDIYLMRMSCPAIARSVLPGQFVNIKVNHEYIPLLRKPFSVCRRSSEEGWIEVLWKVVGKGTQTMSHYRVGDSVNVLGPLGQGFRTPAALELALLVAGGIGVAPFPFLCEVLLAHGISVEIFLGARSERELSFVEEFEDMGAEVFIATDDGSRGRKGVVTDLLVERISQVGSGRNLHHFSCGPTGFLNAMIDLTEGLGVDGQLSLETMMGCGFGICVGCPVETRAPGPSDQLYRLTCIDGPVFDARSVILQ